MNRQLWKCLKLFTGIFVIYLLILNLSFHYSKQQLPFKQQQQQEPRKSVMDSIFGLFEFTPQEPPQSEERDTRGKDLVSLKTESSASSQDNGVKLRVTHSTTPDNRPDRGTYSEALLKTPQQFFNYTRDIKDRHILWPEEAENRWEDRILSQMRWQTPRVPRKEKTILVYTGLRDGMQTGSNSLKKLNCPVSECHLTSNKNKMSEAELVLWHDHIYLPTERRPRGQIWAVFLLESPYHTPALQSMNGLVNWTMTYRKDSTLVAPYERFTYFDEKIKEIPQMKNYAEGKDKMVAWFVSNCGARNNRLGYAQELAKHIQVDIYGHCGDKSCPKNNPDCFDKLTKEYRFYLAFENSNCRDYITEKFFVNGLKNDVIPIAMGAHPLDYKAVAPTHSYIHVDDFESPAALADYLLELANDEQKYNEYFKWKGSGDNINTFFWCRVCALTHAAETTQYNTVYKDLENWWRGPQVCQDETNGYIWPKWAKS